MNEYWVFLSDSEPHPLISVYAERIEQVWMAFPHALHVHKVG